MLLMRALFVDIVGSRVRGTQERLGPADGDAGSTHRRWRLTSSLATRAPSMISIIGLARQPLPHSIPLQTSISQPGALIPARAGQRDLESGPAPAVQARVRQARVGGRAAARTSIPGMSFGSSSFTTSLQLGRRTGQRQRLAIQRPTRGNRPRCYPPYSRRNNENIVRSIHPLSPQFSYSLNTPSC